MADQPEAAAAPEPKRKGLAVALLATGAIAGAAGAGVPLLLRLEHPPDSHTVAAEPQPATHEPLTAERAEFIPFGDITVNLNEGRLNRYLRLKIALQVDKLQVEKVTQAIEKQKLVLRNWLLSHLSDKDQEQIRGAAGQNLLRREIRERFNALLFDDGYDRIYDVLFEEFNIQ